MKRLGTILVLLTALALSGCTSTDGYPGDMFIQGNVTATTGNFTDLTANNGNITNVVTNDITINGTITSTITGVLYGNGTAISAIPTPIMKFEPTAAGAWYDAAYSRYCTLTFSSGATGTLTNAPIIFTLNGTQLDYETTKTDGSDVIFVDTDNLTLLTQPVAKVWNLYGTSTFTAIVPNLPNTPYTIYCYWGLP